MSGNDSVERSLDLARELSDIRAVVTINDEALREADRISSSGVEPVPVAVKDNIDTVGLRTTMASEIYRDRVPVKDARAIARMRRAGYVVLGKANLHEFASGVTTTSSIFGHTLNPVDRERIAGGSSGGSAAAVAAGIVEVALGSDTAGSVRIPASLTGTIGYIPTHDYISRDGVYPLADSFDDVGIIAKSFGPLTRLAETLLERRLKNRYLNLENTRFAVITGGLFSNGAVEREFMDLASEVNALEFSLPVSSEKGNSAFRIIRLGEALSVHLQNRSRWGEYTPDVSRMLQSAINFTSSDYIGAKKIESEVRTEAASLFRKVDVIMCPTTPVPAPKISEILGKEDGEVRTTLTRNTMFASMAGLPAVSIPLFNSNGLPVGLQLIGKAGDDLTLIGIARKILEER